MKSLSSRVSSRQTSEATAAFSIQPGESLESVKLLGAENGMFNAISRCHSSVFLLPLFFFLLPLSPFLHWIAATFGGGGKEIWVGTRFSGIGSLWSEMSAPCFCSYTSLGIFIQRTIHAHSMSQHILQLSNPKENAIPPILLIIARWDSLWPLRSNDLQIWFKSSYFPFAIPRRVIWFDLWIILCNTCQRH